MKRRHLMLGSLAAAAPLSVRAVPRCLCPSVSSWSDKTGVGEKYPLIAHFQFRNDSWAAKGF